MSFWIFEDIPPPQKNITFPKGKILEVYKNICGLETILNFVWSIVWDIGIYRYL